MGSRREPLAAALALYRRAQDEGHGSLDYSAIALTTGGSRAVSTAIEQLIEELRVELGVQRATVRVDVPEAYFPVRYEALAPGAGSLRDDPTDLTKQPVPRVLAERGGQVVQEDAAAAFPDDRASTRCASATAECARRSSRGATATATWSRCCRSTTCARRGASGRPSGSAAAAAAAEIARMLDGTA